MIGVQVSRNFGRRTTMDANANLSIKAFCQSCGAEHAFDPVVVGRRARCKSCGFVFRVPDLPPGEPGAAPDRAAGEPAAAPSTVTLDPATPTRLVGVEHPSKSDPLAQLATAESSVTAPEPQAPASTRPVAVIGDLPADPRATVTALTIILGLFYVAVIAIGVVLLEAFAGIVITIWILLPVVVVHGRRTLTHIAFLLTGRTPAV